MTDRVFWAVLLVAALTVASVAWGQEAANMEQLNRALRESEKDELVTPRAGMTIGERGLLDYGATASFDFIAIDDVNQRTHILRMYDNKFFADLSVDGHEFYGRLRYTYQDWNDGDDFDGKGDHYVYPIADRWWYRFDLRKALESSGAERPDWNVRLTVGRQFIDWAGGLVFSNELYAVRGAVECGPVEFEGFVGLTPASTFIDFDSSRTHFFNDTDRLFYSGKVAYTGFKHHRPYFYALHQQDRNGNDVDVLTVPPATPVSTSFNYDSTYLVVGSTGELTGKLSYTAEFAYEMGESLSSSVDPTGTAAAGQREEDICAWATRLNLTYHFRDPWRSVVELETILASGDDDRVFDTSNTLGGNRAGTADHAFNGFGYAKTGVAFDAPMSNMMMFRVGASTFPRLGEQKVTNLRVGMDFFVFNKLDSDAPIDEPSSNGRYLGCETDVYATWRIVSDVSLNVRYGVFFPGDAVGSDHDPRQFLFTGVTYSF